MDIESTSKQISSLLYEVIAYFGSACFALVLFVWGLLNATSLNELKIFIGTLGTWELFVLVIIAVTIAYVYGQLASALSASVISTPFSRFAERFRKRVSPDFDYNFSDVISSCSLDIGLPDNKLNNKWTLIYYVVTVAPHVGRDIIKRQARERLARINAMNMLLLALLSLFGLLASWLGLTRYLPFRDILRVPSPWYIALCLLLTAAFAYEFYKRKCWNNDLLVKILPAIRRLAEASQRG